MPEKKLKKIIEQSEIQVLLPNEKEEVFLRLKNFIEQNPIQEPGSVKANHSIRTWYADFVRFFAKKPILRYGLLVAIIFLGSGAGVCFAAQQSLPGDPLYEIKTNVNEKLFELVLLSDQAKARYDISLVKLRLQETETLASKNRLNNATSTQLTALLGNHIADIAKNLSAIQARQQTNTAIEINSDLEGSLASHAQVLSKIAQKNSVSRFDIENFISGIEDKASVVASARQADEEKLSSDTSVSEKSQQEIDAKNKMDEATRAMQEVAEFLNHKKADISEATYEKATADILLANNNMADGKSKFEAKDYAGAFISFQNAIRLIQQVTIYVSSEADLGNSLQIDLRIHGDEKNSDANSTSNNKNTSDSNVINKIEEHLPVNIIK